MTGPRLLRWTALAGVTAMVVTTINASAQPYGTPAAKPTTAPTAAASAAAKSSTKTFKAEEIEQLVAPISLYPDALLSQVLMASTYPMEVVMAQRWVAQNKTLKGDALTKALEVQTWDPTVKSLVNFPDTLNMMSEKLDWTIKLGDAFLAQQKETLDAVQRLRGKAKAAGNLATNEQQKVIVAPAPATQSATASTTTTQIITIEPANPQVVYVPTYNPTVVYGTWPYPAYPPYYYYPPSYPVGTRAVWFGAGLALGAAWGYAWGGCNWGHGDVDIDINRNTNINNNINREKYKNEINARREAGGGRDSAGRVSDRQTFQHDPSHRRGVTYRDQGTAQRFGQSSAGSVQSRDAYRGRADAGRQEISRGNVQAPRPGAGSTARPANTGNFGGSSGGVNRTPSATNRPSSSSGSRSVFSGSQSSGTSTRSASTRGQTSRSGGSSWSGGGGGSRGGGGARPAPSRGGGGARGGGGRR